jgi:hypothetical protein
LKAFAKPSTFVEEGEVWDRGDLIRQWWSGEQLLFILRRTDDRVSDFDENGSVEGVVGVDVAVVV